MFGRIFAAAAAVALLLLFPGCGLKYSKAHERRETASLAVTSEQKALAVAARRLRDRPLDQLGMYLDAADAARRFVASGRLAQLWLVPNPPHHPAGDFAIGADGLALNEAPPGGERLTFSTIALYRRALFEPPWCDIPPGNPRGVAAPLAPLLRRAIAAGQVGAERYLGPWTDVGTPERLAALNVAVS